MSTLCINSHRVTDCKIHRKHFFRAVYLCSRSLWVTGRLNRPEGLMMRRSDSFLCWVTGKLVTSWLSQKEKWSNFQVKNVTKDIPFDSIFISFHVLCLMQQIACDKSTFVSTNSSKLSADCWLGQQWSTPRVQMSATSRWLLWVRFPLQLPLLKRNSSPVFYWKKNVLKSAAALACLMPWVNKLLWRRLSTMRLQKRSILYANTGWTSE